MPILLTAAGRAFFAHCSQGRRERIVQEFRSSRSERTSLANNSRLVDQLTQRVLEDGYAINDGDWEERRLGAVAVQIRDGHGRAVASISLIYTRHAVKQKTIDDVFVPALLRSARSVEALL